MKNFFSNGLIGLDLSELAERIKSCTKCPLSENRTNAVPGEGDPDSDVLFIGEGPGREEDLQGRPFVGRAGQKLNDILASVDIERESVYITNMVKCRPPENRSPKRGEISTCFPYLEAQIASINPSLIITLGNSATKFILDTDQGITSIRGQLFDWRGEIRVFPMYHPSYLLRNPSTEEGSPKYQTWQDIQKVKDLMPT